MNYPFYLNLIDLLADEKITVSQLVQNLGNLKENYYTKTAIPYVESDRQP